jgi:hypothetical protein
MIGFIFVLYILILTSLDVYLAFIVLLRACRQWLCEANILCNYFYRDTIVTDDYRT